MKLLKKIRYTQALLLILVLLGASLAPIKTPAQQGPTYKKTLERCINRANKLWGKRDSVCKRKITRKKRKRCYRANKRKYQRRVAECKKRYK